MRKRLDIPLFTDEIGKILDCDIPERMRGKAIRFITTDSREITKGDLFIGLKGKSYDGSDYLTEALERGAIPLVSVKSSEAIVCEDTEEALLKIAALYKSKLKKLKCTVAITGSVGKSTAKEFLKRILEKSFKVTATEGNYNNAIGSSMSVLSAHSSTEALVLELGMNHKGEISRMAKHFRPDISVITNVGSSHIGNLGSREAIAEAKLEILDGGDGMLIYPKGEPLLSGRGGLCFSLTDPTADFYLTNQYEKISFFKGERWILDSSFHLKERHLLSCLAPAIAVSLLIGVPVSAVVSAVDEISYLSIKQRFINIGNITVYSDLYNASAESLYAALEFVSKTVGYKKRSALIGTVLELGEKSREIHRQIGKRAAGFGLSRLYLFGEGAPFMAEGALSEGYSPVRIFLTSDLTMHGKVAEDIYKNSEEGELILFKGSRGMELERVIDRLTKKYESEK